MLLVDSATYDAETGRRGSKELKGTESRWERGADVLIANRVRCRVEKGYEYNVCRLEWMTLIGQSWAKPRKPLSNHSSAVPTSGTVCKLR